MKNPTLAATELVRLPSGDWISRPVGTLRPMLTLAELDRLTPFGASVTWPEFAALVAEAHTVLVCFYAFTRDPKEPRVGRAIKISKDDALRRAEEGQSWHPTGDERVNVSAASGNLYFGGA